MSTRGKRPDDDFAEEIRSHLAHEADDLMAAGADPEVARGAARRRGGPPPRRFGNVTAAEERFFEARRWLWLDRARQDARDAIRSIVRYPVASAVAMLSMAAGIGVATVTLMVRNVIFHNPPLEYGDPGALSIVQVGRGANRIMPIGSYPPGELVALWTDALGGNAVAAAVPPRGIRDVRTADRTETISVRTVSTEFFEVLGVRPVAGRTFAPDDDGGAPAILGYRLWQQWFDRSPGAIGQTVWIDDRPHTIVGVLPPAFWFTNMDSPIWTRADRDTLRAQESLEVVVRRGRGLTPAALASQLDASVKRYAASQPADQRTLRLLVSPLEGTPMGRQMSILLPWVLGIAALLTLLIACANVAILTIAQWTAREHEISIRASIGASRARLIRSLLTESLLLAALGGLLGVGATLILRGVIVRSGTDATLFNLSIPWNVFAECAGATVAAGILTGLAPALLETRRLHGNPMRVNAMTDHLRQRWRHALVVLEIGFTVALLVVAASFINGYQRSINADMGFAAHPLLSANVQNPKGVPIDAVMAAITGMPGVASAAASTSVPYTVNGPRGHAAAIADGGDAVNVERSAIAPGFFETLGVSMRSGRSFSSQDAGNGRMAIVNSALARRLFGSSDDVAGRRIYLDGAAYDIVGVVADFANQPFFREYDPRVFLPLTVAPAPTRIAFVIRAAPAGDAPEQLVPMLRRTIRDAATGNVVTNAFTFTTIRTITSQEILAGTAPLAPLIVIGLLLTAAGIYGVLAFAVARRSRELAVRVAIGATGRDLVQLVSRHTARLVATGAALGVGLTFALSRIVRAAGGAGSPFDADWTAFAVPIVVIAMVAAIATWVPSRRVRKIDPAVLLRV